VNPRTTGILFLVAAALAAFVYFYVIQGEEGRREADEAEKRLFVGVEADDIEAVALTASDGTAVRAERREDRWEIVEPLVFPGDVYAFDAMASALAQITGETAIEDPQPAPVYGLDADEHEVRFTAGGEERALRVGDKTPLGSNSYVSVVGGDGVYTVPTHRVNSFVKAFDDLREKRVLDFDREAVDRIEASWRDGRVVLERGDAGWTVVEPVEGPADEETVEGLLSDLSFLRASGFVDAPPPDADTGLDRPAFAARLSGSGSGSGGDAGEAGEPFEVALAIGSRPDGDSRLARSAGTTLYRISEDRLEDLPTDLVAYRFKELARFAALDAKRVEILFHTALGESIAISAERTEAGWTSQPESFEPGKLAALVGALADLRAQDIAAESMGAAELAGVALAPANAIFTVFGAAAEGGEGAEGEAPTLAEVHVGAVRGTDGIIAQRAGDDTVFVLDYALAEHLPVSYEAFENRFRSEATAAEPVEPTPQPEPEPALAE
jgi:hypothetical protein